MNLKFSVHDLKKLQNKYLFILCLLHRILFTFTAVCKTRLYEFQLCHLKNLRLTKFIDKNFNTSKNDHLNFNFAKRHAFTIQDLKFNVKDFMY